MALTDAETEDRAVVSAYLAKIASKENAELASKENEEDLYEASSEFRALRGRRNMYSLVRSKKSSFWVGCMGLMVAGFLSALVFAAMDQYEPVGNEFFVIVCAVGLILGPGLMALQLCFFPLQLRRGFLSVRIVLSSALLIPGFSLFIAGMSAFENIRPREIFQALICFWSLGIVGSVVAIVLQFMGWRMTEFEDEDAAAPIIGIPWIIELTTVIALLIAVAVPFIDGEILLGIALMSPAAIVAAFAVAALLRARLCGEEPSRIGTLISVLVCIFGPFAALVAVFFFLAGSPRSAYPLLDVLFVGGCSLPASIIATLILWFTIEHLGKCGWQLHMRKSLLAKSSRKSEAVPINS